MAGYSEKPLFAKLGYAPGDSVYVFGHNEAFETYLQEQNVWPADSLPATWTHGFFMSVAELLVFIDSHIMEQTEKGVWVSWLKKSSGIQTDIGEQTFRDHLLPLGWVDTKVAAIDETWSGLLFYRRRS